MDKNVYDHIRSNNIITMILIFLFPFSFFLMFYVVSFVLLYFFQPEPLPIAAYFQQITNFCIQFFPYVVGGALIWLSISYFWGDKMMLRFAGARQADTNNPKERKIKLFVETSAIAAGLPVPKVYIIDDNSLNAFATGHSPKTASVALTSGIIARLEPLELQAVVAHEMAHIGNRDIRLDMMIITGLGIFGFAAELAFRMIGSGGRRSNSKGGGQAIVFILAFAITCWLFNKTIAPVLHMAISRTREYAADASAALITRNPQALANALAKISQDPKVEALESSPLMAVACIYPPLSKSLSKNTHPPVSERIQRLREMAGSSAFQSYNIS